MIDPPNTLDAVVVVVAVTAAVLAVLIATGAAVVVGFAAGATEEVDPEVSVTGFFADDPKLNEVPPPNTEGAAVVVAEPPNTDGFPELENPKTDPDELVGSPPKTDVPVVADAIEEGFVTEATVDAGGAEIADTGGFVTGAELANDDSDKVEVGVKLETLPAPPADPKRDFDTVLATLDGAIGFDVVEVKLNPADGVLEAVVGAKDFPTVSCEGAAAGFAGVEGGNPKFC